MLHRNSANSEISDILSRLIHDIETVPPGTYFDNESKDGVVRTLKRTDQSDAVLANLLARTLNAIELDRRVPPVPPVEISAGKRTAADLSGIASLAFRRVERSGRVTLRVVNAPALPATLTGYIPGWPFASYQFQFDGSLAKTGYVDLTLYAGGLYFPGGFRRLRLIEVDGQIARDITTKIDAKAKTVTGRTNKLSHYVIMMH